MRELARPVAVAILRRGDSILVVPIPDHVKNVTGYRPPGGTIEFGEAGADAVVREMQEEFGVAVVDLRYLGTLENIFTYIGQTGHELVRVYSARFADESLYLRSEFACLESDGVPFTAVWKRIADFEREPLYPSGLLDLIRG